MKTIKFRAFEKSGKMIPWGELRKLPAITIFQQSDGYHVMQFTGLHDKNGKEIYEGDVVLNLRFDSIAQIVWKESESSNEGIVEGVFGELCDLDGFITLGKFVFEGIGSSTKAFFWNELEVIGNIYSNPELLNQ